MIAPAHSINLPVRRVYIGFVMYIVHSKIRTAVLFWMAEHKHGLLNSNPVDPIKGVDSFLMCHPEGKQGYHVEHYSMSPEGKLGYPYLKKFFFVTIGLP